MNKDDADLPRAWERGEPVELQRARPPTSVLSIRVPSELLEALSRRAKAQGRPTSHVARDLVEVGLQSEGPSTPTELAKAFSRWAEEVEAESITLPEKRGSVQSFGAGRLAHWGERIPTVEELGLDPLRREAFQWQRARSCGEIQTDRLHEIGGLFGTSAELVLVSIEAEIEKQILLRHLDSGGSCTFPFAHWRALRFFAEGQINYLVVAGHKIANLTLRALALHQTFDPAKIDRKLDPRAWISLNAETARGLSRAAKATSSMSLVAMTQALSSLEKACRGLFEVRAEQYQDLPAYEGAASSIRRIADTGRQALDAFAESMPEIRERWLNAKEELTQARD